MNQWKLVEKKTALLQNDMVQTRLLVWAIAQCLLHHDPAEGVVIFNLWLQYVRWIDAVAWRCRQRSMRCWEISAAVEAKQADVIAVTSAGPGPCSIWHLSAGRDVRYVVEGVRGGEGCEGGVGGGRWGDESLRSVSRYSCRCESQPSGHCVKRDGSVKSAYAYTAAVWKFGQAV